MFLIIFVGNGESVENSAGADFVARKVVVKGGFLTVTRPYVEKSYPVTLRRVTMLHQSALPPYVGAV